jgi:hypothetical protein
MKIKAIQLVGYSDYETHIYGIGLDRQIYFSPYNFVTRNRSQWLTSGGQFDSLVTSLGEFARIICLGLNYSLYASGWIISAKADWINLGGIFNSPCTLIQETGSTFQNGQPIVNTIIVGLGTDNQPYLKRRQFYDFTEKWYPSLQDWHPLGGRLIYEPIFAFYKNANSLSRLELFGVGIDRQMNFMAIDCSKWPPTNLFWIPCGGCFISPPAVVKWNKTRIDIFGIGTDNSMYHRAMENGSWIINWELLGGTFDSQPEVVSSGEHRLDIFAVGTDGQMYHKAWDGDRWLPSTLGWEPLGGNFISAPSASAWTFRSAPADSLGKSRIDIVGIGTDSQLYHKAWDKTKWLPSQLDWQPLGGLFLIPRPTKMPTKLEFDFPVNFNDGTKVDGNLHIEMHDNGQAVFNLHLHANGLWSYACSVACAIIDIQNRAYTFQATGKVYGTFLPGSRNFDLNISTEPNLSLKNNFNDMFSCGGSRFGARVDVQTIPPGGLIINVGYVLKQLPGNTPLTIIPLLGKVY